MQRKQNVGLSNERKQSIRKKVIQLLGPEGNRISMYTNETGSIDIQKLTRAVATTNYLSRHRSEVAEYIKSIFEQNKRANQIIAEEMKNFNVRKA